MSMSPDPTPEPPAAVNPVYTVAVLPDTQGYTLLEPDIFFNQTEWLTNERQSLNLAMVVQVGDLVEHSWSVGQWDIARAAMGVLDGHVPYIISPGNHDYGRIYEERNSRARTTYFQDYFPLPLFEAMPTFGGVYPDGERTDNSYQLFEIGDQPWLVMALEFAPRDEVLAWANQVLNEHADRLAIIATHAYLYYDDTRYDWAKWGDSQMWSPYVYGVFALPDGLNDGQEMWDKLLSKHANVVAVLCGHTLADGLGYAISDGAGEVHELLANYQMNDMGGAGFLRLMQFDPIAAEVKVYTYSPWLDMYERSPANEFTFSYASHLR
ncbi:metallophosphoesterase [Haliangium sp.]|uniref:metallophosphoesterase n=1 Tax=Haliangium sp. TaxID=2663208 RepID=UPI003D0F0E5F